MMKNRESNFELMRVISMLFIVMWHILLHGNYINNCSQQSLRIFFTLIQFIIIVHVNSFVLLSGYFQSKNYFKLHKLFNLFIQVIFYAEVLLIIAIKIGIANNITLAMHINNFLPSTISNYWFVNCYIIVYILSDYLNKFINKLDYKEFKYFLLLLFMVFSVLPYFSGQRFISNNGYTFYNFIFLYFIGAFLRMYPLNKSDILKKFSKNSYKLILITIFILCAIINFLLNNFAFSSIVDGSLLKDISTKIGSNFLSYSSPFVIIQTITYFELFNNMKLANNKFINFLSLNTFGVYLIHDNNYVRAFLYKYLKIDNGLNTIAGYQSIIKLFLFTIGIFVACAIIESARRLIEKVIMKIPFIKKKILKIKNYFNNFKINLVW